MTNLKSNRQSGFAIGTILLAVILIAAIVSAIAIASRGTSSQSNREGARVQASTIIQQGINIKNGFDRMIGTGTDGTAIQMSLAGTGNTTAAVSGTIMGTTGTNCVSGDPCLYDATAGGTSVQSPPAQAFVAIPPANIRYTLRRLNVFRGTGFVGTGTAVTGDDKVILLSGLRLDVCQQINALVSGNTIALNATPDTLTVAAVLTDNDDAAVTAFSAAGSSANVPNPEGCVQQNGSAGQYMYYKVVVER